LTVKALDSWYF